MSVDRLIVTFFYGFVALGLLVMAIFFIVALWRL
jgi:hypothetical protein